MCKNLEPGQLVVMGSLEDISKRGQYRLGRVHEVLPQIRNGKPIVRRAKIALANLNDSGEVKIDYVMRDISRLAPVKTTCSH